MTLPPAVSGFKDAQGLIARFKAKAKAKATLPNFRVGDLANVGSQTWVARVILGTIVLGILGYGYGYFWMIPQHSRRLAALQPEIQRLRQAKPRTLGELQDLNGEFDRILASLRSISSFSGSLHTSAQGQIRQLSPQAQRLKDRLTLEEQGDRSLRQAKRLAAQADVLAYQNPQPSEAIQRQIQQQWLGAYYWSTLVPSHTFEDRNARQLRRLYQRNYQSLAQNTPVVP